MHLYIIYYKLTRMMLITKKDMLKIFEELLLLFQEFR